MDVMPDRDPTLQQEALDWFTRLRADDLSSDERLAFERWAMEPQNAQAYDQVERLWQAVEAPAQQVRRAEHRPSRVRAWPRYAAAACLLMIVGIAWLTVPGLRDEASDYRTAIGERREVLLSDGSRLWLDSASAVDVDLQGATRRVWLRHGRLFADVVHDGRPFEVHVDEARVEVLGTRFSVSRADEGDEGDEVVLLSGRVQVRTDEQRQVLAPGQRLLVRQQRVLAPQPVNAEQLLAWRSGQLRVRDEPLGQVLQQLAGYQGKRLVLLNEAAGQRRISGSFNLDRADMAFDALLSNQHLNEHVLFGRWSIVR